MKCFLDMDGVLSDFNGGVAKVHNRPDPYLNPTNHGIYDTEKIWGMSSTQFYKPTNSVEFWAGLGKMPEADNIVALVTQRFGEGNIAILSAPSPFIGCAGAKRMWVRKHYPQLEKRLILATAGTKHFIAAPSKVLIDDRDSNVAEWVVAGGIGILVPRPWNNEHPFHRDVTEWLVNGLEAI